MKRVRRPDILIPADRLPVELQDGLGFRFLSQVPTGPMRDSVEGYLAMPPDKRGAGTFAYKIVVAAVRAEQERQKTARGTMGRFLDLTHELKSADLQPDLDRESAGVIETESVPFDSVPPSSSNHSDGRVRFEFEDPTGPGVVAEVPIPSDRQERPLPDPAPVTWRRPSSETEEEPTEPPPIAADGPVEEHKDAAEDGPITAEGPVGPDADDRHEPAAAAETASRGSRVRSARPAAQPLRSADVRRAVTESAQGWSTAFEELDALGLRWVPGELTLVHGPPGGGRTAFLLELLRRYAEGRGGAIYVSGRERRTDVFVRLIQAEVARMGHAAAPSITPALIEDWFRDPTSVHPAQADALAGASQHLDDLVSWGGLVLAEGGGDGVNFGGWASDLADRSATEGPALVIVDDAAEPDGSGRSADGPSLFRIVRRMRRIAGGRGPGSRVPVIFSLPFPPTGEGAGRLGTVLRVDALTDASRIRVSVDRNRRGPRGGSVELALPTGGPDAPPPA